MKILTKEQREKSLALLARAPDEILLSAVVEMRKHWHLKQSTLVNYDIVMSELEGATQAIDDMEKMPPNVVEFQGGKKEK
jgi:hypothetical protein